MDVSEDWTDAVAPPPYFVAEEVKGHTGATHALRCPGCGFESGTGAVGSPSVLYWWAHKSWCVHYGKAACGLWSWEAIEAAGPMDTEPPPPPPSTADTANKRPRAAGSQQQSKRSRTNLIGTD